MRSSELESSCTREIPVLFLRLYFLACPQVRGNRAHQPLELSMGTNRLHPRFYTLFKKKRSFAVGVGHMQLLFFSCGSHSHLWRGRSVTFFVFVFNPRCCQVLLLVHACFGFVRMRCSLRVQACSRAREGVCRSCPAYGWRDDNASFCIFVGVSLCFCAFAAEENVSPWFILILLIPAVILVSTLNMHPVLLVVSRISFR